MGKQRPIDLSAFDEVVSAKEIDLSAFDEIVKKKASPQDLNGGSPQSGIGSNPFQATPKPEIPTVLIGKAKEEAQAKFNQNKEKVAKEQPEPKKKADGGAGKSFMKGLSSYNESIYNLPKYLYDLSTSIPNAISDLTNNPDIAAIDYDTIVNATGFQSPLSILRNLSRIEEVKSGLYDKQIEKFDKGVYDSIKDGDYKAAGQQVLNNFTESAPSMIGMIFTGAAGNAAKLSKVGSTIAKTLPFASIKNTELQNDSSVPNYLKPINATFNGLAEVVFDQEFGTSAIVGDVLKTFANEGRELAIKKTKDFVTGYITNAIKKFQPITSGVKNAVEEMTTLYSQNLVDKLTIDPDRDVFQGWQDAAIMGGATGTAIQSVGTINGLLNSKKKSKLNEYATRRGEIIADLDNPELSDDIKTELVDQLERQNDKISKISDDAELVLSNLPEKEQAEVVEIQNNIDVLEKSLNVKDISDGTKKHIESQIEKQQEKLDVLAGAADIISDSQQPEISQQNTNQPQEQTNLEPTAKQDTELNNGETTTGTTKTDTGIEANPAEGTAEEAGDNQAVSAIGSEVVNDTVNDTVNESSQDNTAVLEKAEADLTALKQVSDKVKKYDASVKRLTEAKNTGLLTDTEFNDIKARFDDVISEYTPKDVKVTKLDEAIPEDAQDEVAEELEIEGEVKTPTQEKLDEIKAKRQEITARIRSKAGQLSSGFNPEVIGDLVELGATYVQEGVVRFKDFATRLKADYGDEIPDSVIKDVFSQSAEANGMGIRKFTESVQGSELSEDVKAAVDGSGYKLYNKQEISKLEVKVDNLSETERVSAVAGLGNILNVLMDADSNYGVLAGISLMNQYSAEGRVEDADKIAEMLSKSSTTIAQTLRQFGELKKSSPLAFVKFVEKYLAQKGRAITEAEIQRIKELFEGQKKAFEELENAQNIHIDQLTETTRKEYWTALGAYDIATRELEDYIADLLPKDAGDTTSSVLKGNLLTLKSLIANPIYNIAYSQIRFAKGEIANITDLILSSIAGTPRTKISSLSPEAFAVAGQSIVRGSKEAYKQMMKGSSGGDLAKYDINRRLKPLDAWKRIWSTSDENKQRKRMEKVSDFIEGTFGWTANANFRLLPFGDTPFFELAKNQRLLEIAKTKGFQGGDIERFMIKPDAASLKSAVQYGKEATFQDNNVLSTTAMTALNFIGEHASNYDPAVGAAVKLLITTSFPFVKTPASVALKIVTYSSPILPGINTIIETNKTIEATKAYKKNPSDLNRERVMNHQRRLSEAVADVAISTVLTSVATIIAANGLLTGSAPDDKEKKEKDFMYSTQQPFTINISGLKRLMKGGDPSFKEHDTIMNYNNFGVFGAVMGIVNDTRGAELKLEASRAKKKGLDGKPFYPETDGGTRLFLDILKDNISTLPASFKYLTEQSFLQGVEGMLSALQEGDYDGWFTKLYRTLLSIPVPNTFVQLNKGWRENMRNPYTKDTIETFLNVTKERIQIGEPDDLPMRIDIWGQPVKQTPEGSNPIIYQAIDPFRTQSMLNDPLTLKVFDLYRKTDNLDAAPSPVPKYISIRGEKRDLTPKEFQELSQIIGLERKKYAEIVLADYKPNQHDRLEYFIDRLKVAYRKGSERGIRIFRRDRNMY